MCDLEICSLISFYFANIQNFEKKKKRKLYPLTELTTSFCGFVVNEKKNEELKENKNTQYDWKKAILMI